jgi:excisionase family DNA binding protein
MTSEDKLPACRLDARLLTIDQVSEVLQISRWTVYRLIWANELRSVQSDGAAAFPGSRSTPTLLS